MDHLHIQRLQGGKEFKYNLIKTREPLVGRNKDPTKFHAETITKLSYSYHLHRDNVLIGEKHLPA